MSEKWIRPKYTASTHLTPVTVLPRRRCRFWTNAPGNPNHLQHRCSEVLATMATAEPHTRTIPALPPSPTYPTCTPRRHEALNRLPNFPSLPGTCSLFAPGGQTKYLRQYNHRTSQPEETPLRKFKAWKSRGSGPTSACATGCPPPPLVTPDTLRTQRDSSIGTCRNRASSSLWPQRP